MKNTTFAYNIDKFVKHSKASGTEVVRKVALDMFTRVILRSPVKTGRFRANWQCTVAGPASGKLTSTDKAGTATVAKMAGVVKDLAPGQVIWLVNNLPYGRRLEYGSSQQAPTGMVRVTIREFNAILKKAAAAARRRA
jgi:hypothetical protein